MLIDGGFKKEQKNNVAQTTVINHPTDDTPREPTISDFAMVSGFYVYSIYLRVVKTIEFTSETGSNFVFDQSARFFTFRC